MKRISLCSLRNNVVDAENSVPAPGSLTATDVLDIHTVVRLAGELGYSQIQFNKASRVISFGRGQVRINVYYTTGTVSTCLDHPVQGKTQLFRRKVDIRSLREIFDNPRMHTDAGHHRRANKPGAQDAKDSHIGAPNEETALSYALSELEKEVYYISQKHAELSASLRNLRVEKAMQIAREQEKQDAIKRRRLEEEAKAARASQEAMQRAKEEKLRQALTLKGKGRGNDFHYLLHYTDGFPDNLDDIKCIAIGEGGFLAIKDNGSCMLHGIPSDAAEIVRKQHYKNMDYMAIGACGQYYASKKNGRSMWSSNLPSNLVEIFLEHHIEMVAFGPYSDTFCVVYAGGVSWDGDIDAKAEHLFCNFQIKDAWLGGYDRYFVRYIDEGGQERISYKGLPEELQRHMSVKNRKVKQVLVDEYDSFFVRFTDNA